MIQKIIDLSIRHKGVVCLLMVAWVIGGLYALRGLPLDAVPDITNNQVQIITVAPDLGAEDIEQFISYAVEVNMANLPGVEEIRSVSRFGLSVVTVVFDEDMGTFLPRQLVNEQLGKVQEQIPQGFGTPEMGPITTGLGEVYQYILKVDDQFSDRYNLTDLREMQDWIIRRQMAMVPGVVEVNGFGGAVKQYEVQLNPDQLNGMNLTIADVYQALEKNNANTGGAYIERNHKANFIRGEGLLRSVADIEQVVVTNNTGLPILIKDVGKVAIGHAIRYGALTADGQGETVGGMVMMLKGGNSNQVIGAIKERMAQIQKSLPEGVRIVPFHDRSELVAQTTSTVIQNLLEGGLIVVFILVLLLGNWRGGLIVASTIPLSLLFAFMMMRTFGVWANLMSLGAIDFGIIVDGAVIIVESAVFMLHQRLGSKQEESRDEVVRNASGKMMNAAFFGQLIILIVFIPLLALEGVEGKMFKPMALTFSFAIVGAMILCLTYVPMVSAYFLKVKERSTPNFGARAVAFLERKFEPVLTYALNNGKKAIGIAVVFLVVSFGIFSRMGGEFIPKLDEGDFAFHVILKPGSALSETIDGTSRVERLIMEHFPEVKHVVSRIGVADVPTDPMPMDVADVIVNLKPKDQWREGMSKQQLVHEVEALLTQVPGINFEFTQPIEMRFNELLTGVREDIAVKIYGDDLKVLAKIAKDAGALIQGIDGVGDLKVEATDGQPQMQVKLNRAHLAKYGASVEEVNEAIHAAFAGGVAGTIFEGERRFELVVRLAKSHRQDITDLQQLYIRLENGVSIPLSELATISYEPGPMQISRDDTNRRTYVGINVRGRDVASLVGEIQQRLDEQLQMPPGYFVRYGGAFENFERAKRKLQLLVPMVLLLIFVLVYFALGKIKETLMIYMAIPMAVVGGIVSLWLRGMPFSISAGVGFIVLFGVAVLNGLVLIQGYEELAHLPLRERLIKGTTRRLRPILLTASTDILGFLPMAISNGAGAEVQRPLATVVIGGLFTACLLTLVILPILYQFIHQSKKMQGSHIKAVMATFLMLVLPFSLRAQATQTMQNEQDISLEQALERARNNYPSLKQAAYGVAQQKALRQSAYNFGSTQISSGGEEIGTDGRGVYTPVMFSQQNIDVFGMHSKAKYFEQAGKTAEAFQQLQWQNLKKRVSKDWVLSSVAYARMEWMNRFMAFNQDFEQRAKLMYESEATGKLDYLAARNKMQLLKTQQAQVHQDYYTQLAGLQQWLMTDTMFVVKATPEQYLQPLSVNAADVGAHPLLLYYQQQTALADQAVNVEQAKFLPKLNVQYGWQRIEGQSGFYTWQAGISLPLVFNAQKGKIKAAKMAREGIHAQQLEQAVQLKTQLKQQSMIFAKWQRSVDNYRSVLLPLAEEQIETARFSYEKGAVDYISYIQSMDGAMQVYQAYYDALGALLVAQIDLEYLLTQL